MAALSVSAAPTAGRSSLAPMTRSSDARRPSSAHGLRQSTVGRQSTGMAIGAGGSRLSVAGSSLVGTGPSIGKDPRPLQDKSWRAEATKQIVKFLSENGCPFTVSAKTLSSPSAKEFGDTFKFLYSRLEPSHQFNSKIEDELLPVLKAIRYPFVDQINKSQLFSIGSPHGWPTFLGILHWLLETIICCQQFDDTDLFDMGPEFSQDSPLEQVFQKYVTSTYNAFLQGDDNFVPIDKMLKKFFKLRDDTMNRDVDRLKQEHTALEKEYASLTHGESPLDTQMRENAALTADCERFSTYISHLETKEQKLIEIVSGLKNEIEITEKEMQRMETEKHNLQVIVEAQQTSQADIDRMNAERDQLRHTLDTVGKKLDEANKLVWDKEIASQKMMDQLDRVVYDYNTHARSLSIIGSKLPELQPIARELEIDTKATRMESMVSVDLKGVGKMLLNQLKEKYTAAVHRAQDDIFALQDKLDSLTWTQTRKSEDISALQSRVAFLNQRYNDDKELERQIQKIKLEINSLLLSAEQKAQKSTSEYESLSSYYLENREKARGKLLSTMAEVLGLYQHITDSVKHLTELANDHLAEASASDAFEVAAAAVTGV
eukprot:jgi/Hompol1/3082/HPOL_001557-RA